MAGGKETPRQKMIGMMYLVLTALLALNVSKSILQAFVRMDESIQRTNENFEGKNESTYNTFERKYAANQQKVGPFYEAAQKVKEEADGLDGFIDSLKRHLIINVEGLPQDVHDSMIDLGKVSSLSNYDAPTNIMGISQPVTPKEGPWSALKLHRSIDQYKKELKTILQNVKESEGLKSLDTAKVDLGMRTEGDPTSTDPAAKNWEGKIFYHSPLAAVITALSKIQSDVRNAESDVLNTLLSQVSAEDFKFDKIEPFVIEESFVAVGDTYRAQVVGAAYSSTKDPEFSIGQLDTATGEFTEMDSTDSPFQYSVKNGKVQMWAVPKSKGEQLWDGKMVIKQGDLEKVLTMSGGFRAAEQSAVVSPTKMNVFYRGVANPISVSVPGVPPNDLEVRVSGASLRSDRGEGNYIINPGSGSRAVVHVSSKKTGKKFGQKEFRVKRVPDPKPYFLGKTIGDDRIKASRLKLAPGIRAVMENFEFDLKFNVIRFKLSMTVGGQLRTVEQKRGAKITNDMKELLQAAKPGQTIFIRDIMAKGPDGTRPLANLSFTTF